MAMQTGDDLAQASLTPFHAEKSRTAAPLLAAACLLGVVVALGVLAQGERGSGASPPVSDDAGAWMARP